MTTRARHELKHRLTQAEADALARRLRRVLPPDAHGGEGGYRVTSLYFDTPYDEALLEKIDGVSRRDKFRLRYYGTDARLRAGLSAGDFLRPDALMLPVDPGFATLEVKWDRFLPDVVAAAVQLSGRRHASHSKYAACRRHE